ncbi:MAG: LysR family transcriptional regulator [Azospirillaceae bacterium]|nr:LysR family transcriptional regulator [Azospirillaceae bacterium]
MDSVSAFTVFVQVAEARSFVAAGRLLGISASAVGKSIARLEERLAVRLFHRSTRSLSLTAEGLLFLERCRRILGEIEAAELELSHTQAAPRGRLRVSFPLVGELFRPILPDFMRRYPEITLDLDFTDRIVDVVEEGYDVVVRSGELTDSRLRARRLGSTRLLLVGAPDYFARTGLPRTPADLVNHACLHYRFPSTGKRQRWPQLGEGVGPELPVTLVANSIDTLVHVAVQGLGIACVPDFAVRGLLADGRLRIVLADCDNPAVVFRAVWPASPHLAPKVSAFVDFLAARLLPPVLDLSVPVA